MNAQPRILRPRSIRPPWRVAPPWMRTPYLMRAIVAFNPVVLVVAAHLTAAQVMAWAGLVAFWLVFRVLFGLWNWIGLPVLACAHYRWHAWRARRRGDTVGGVVARGLPAAARTAHAIQQAPYAPGPPIAIGPAPGAPGPVALPIGRNAQGEEGVLMLTPHGDKVFQPFEPFYGDLT